MSTIAISMSVKPLWPAIVSRIMGMAFADI